MKSLFDEQMQASFDESINTQNPQIELIDFENLKEQIKDYIGKNSKYRLTKIEPLFINLDDKFLLKVGASSTWYDITEPNIKYNVFRFRIGKRNKDDEYVSDFINRLYINTSNINDITSGFNKKYDDLNHAINAIILNLKDYFTKGEINENIRYEQSNGEFEPSNNAKGNELLPRVFDEPKPLSARSINADEPQNLRADSTKPLTSRTEQQEAFEEIGISPNKANANEYSRQSTRNDNEQKQADNELAKTQGRITATTQGDIRRKEADIAKLSQNVKDNKHLTLIHNNTKLDQNTADLSQVDKDLSLEISSKEFLKAFQEKALELSLMLLEPKELAQLNKTIKTMPKNQGFYEKFWENNINSRAKKFNYDNEKLNIFSKNYFTYLFTQAVQSDTSSKIDLETTNMISKILVDKTKELLFLHNEISETTQNLEEFIDKFQKFQNQTTQRKRK